MLRVSNFEQSHARERLNRLFKLLAVTTHPLQTKNRTRPRLSPGAKVNLIEVLQGPEELATVKVDSKHWRREYYIPLRHGELRTRLTADPRLSEDDRLLFKQFCKLLSATFHYEYHERAEQLKGEYEPFDPDIGSGSHGTAVVHRVAESGERNRNVEQLFEKLVDLLKRANYHKLSQSQIEQAVAAASDWGVRLDVDFSVFERLEVYARGDVIGRRTRHLWRNYYRPEDVDVPIYQRLLVVFQLRRHRRLEKHLDPDSVYIKLFKNIPKEDVDMMLPGVKAKLSLADRGKIILPTALAIYKIVLGAVALAVVGLAGFVGLMVFVGGLAVYGLRALFGYWNTQNKYQLSLTRSLYFQNLDNSSGVLLRLTDEAEEQEFHETVLAYFLLWREAGDEGWLSDELDRAAEKYLTRICNFGIDFEVDDALAKLQRLGLAILAPSGRWRAVPVPAALAALDRAWDKYFEFPS